MSHDNHSHEVTTIWFVKKMGCSGGHCDHCERRMEPWHTVFSPGHKNSQSCRHWVCIGCMSKMQDDEPKISRCIL